MTREEYVAEIEKVQTELLEIGRKVEESIVSAIAALRARDLEAAQQVIEKDDEVDEMQIALEERCIDLIATQQPMAGDLRVIMSVIQVASELERTGDYAEGIAKITLLMGDEPPVKPLLDIPRMATVATSMLRSSLTALVERDVERALAVEADDDEVDALYKQVFRELIVYMLEEPRNIRGSTFLIWIAHDLERIADRATNIAERVQYVATGELRKSRAAEAASPSPPANREMGFGVDGEIRSD